MPEFTSGTQARDRRTVNHDRYPYLWTSGGRTAEGSKWGSRPRCHFAPRPEFAVLDNPILAAFRIDVENEGQGSLETNAEEWLEQTRTDDKYLDQPRSVAVLYERGTHYRTAWMSTSEQIEHARRVLSKLAVLNA